MELRTRRPRRGRRRAPGGPGRRVDGATNDSRDVRPGQLFVPVVAERDGHDFIAAALAAGAAAYLTADRRPKAATAIVVDDTVRALLAAGRLARDRLPGPRSSASPARWARRR